MTPTTTANTFVTFRLLLCSRLRSMSVDLFSEGVWTEHHRGGSVFSFHGNKSLIVCVKHQKFESFRSLQDPLRSSDQERTVSRKVLCGWVWKLDAIFVHVFKLASGCHGKRRGCVVLTRRQLMRNHIFLHNVSAGSLWCQVWPVVLWQQTQFRHGSGILIFLVASFTSVANSNEDHSWVDVSWSCWWERDRRAFP